MFGNFVLNLVTHPLIIASTAVLVIMEAVQINPEQRAAIWGFFVIGVLPNLFVQLWSYIRKPPSTTNSKGEKVVLMLQSRFELWYVFWFSLLTVIYGSGLFNHQGWMIIAMAYAIYHGINLLVVKYFHPINSRVGEVVFWGTLLVNLNPIYAFTYLLLLPLIWPGSHKRTLDLVALNWSLGIGLFSALLTWIS